MGKYETLMKIVVEQLELIRWERNSYKFSVFCESTEYY